MSWRAGYSHTRLPVLDLRFFPRSYSGIWIPFSKMMNVPFMFRTPFLVCVHDFRGHSGVLEGVLRLRWCYIPTWFLMDVINALMWIPSVRPYQVWTVLGPVDWLSLTGFLALYQEVTRNCFFWNVSAWLPCWFVVAFQVNLEFHRPIRHFAMCNDPFEDPRTPGEILGSHIGLRHRIAHLANRLELQRRLCY